MSQPGHIIYVDLSHPWIPLLLLLKHVTTLIHVLALLGINEWYNIIMYLSVSHERIQFSIIIMALYLYSSFEDVGQKSLYRWTVSSFLPTSWFGQRKCIPPWVTSLERRWIYTNSGWRHVHYLLTKQKRNCTDCVSYMGAFCKHFTHLHLLCSKSYSWYFTWSNNYKQHNQHPSLR